MVVPNNNQELRERGNSLKWNRMRKGVSYWYQVPQSEIQVLPLTPLLKPLIPSPRIE